MDGLDELNVSPLTKSGILITLDLLYGTSLFCDTSLFYSALPVFFYRLSILD